MWADPYPKIAQSWRNHWENICPIFSYPDEIRKAVYTTNAIEFLNSVIRHAAKKVIYLAVENASKNGLCQLKIGVLR